MQQPPQPTQENFVSIVSMTLSEVRAGRQQLVVRRADAAEEASCAPAACGRYTIQGAEVSKRLRQDIPDLA
ncbi:hypothetical protein ALP10_101420 [Pseudomonas syringae pv. helianthi]|uniref:Uncharacterized protein n=2 Tax=Pseudomonas syringae group genomosp. 7 TaxID=251699 RepID=A0A3M6CQH9_9PSED|nr:hypothetical protein ALO44_101551 [Pseudomonas syringae pv. tagetis]RMV45496.1 hypothetical protein ALP10_101420 [Pseudomonas syringae pv. helianthi]RMW13837.1 hypothetical protein ALO98_101289 [Pseudomonas syringae pv. tagetis]